MLTRVREALPAGTLAYLVGGAVRDAMLAKPTHDLDFVLGEDAIKIARRVADLLGADFYPLDEDRNYGRVILVEPGEERLVIDFTVFQGGDLEGDLRARDFTINAMAVEIHQPQNLIDPLGGAQDLHKKQLRACSSSSFSSDPLRILRGVRFAASLEFQIQKETRRNMRQSVHLLPGVSSERLRDEFFRILGTQRLPAALQALDLLGVIPYVLPELPSLKGVEQSPPHISDVWDHTLDVVRKLQIVLEILGQNQVPETANNLHMGLMTLKLGRFRDQIKTHVEASIIPDRPVRPILFLSALYHDIGKPSTQTIDEDGRIRFFEHEQIGASQAARRAQALQLSNLEVARIKGIIRHHLRPFLLTQTGRPPTRRAIYKYFRDTGPAGVDVCLLSLADILGTYGPSLPQDTWASHLDVVRTLLEAWWERPSESVSPPALITGHDLMAEFGLKPGPIIGKLLEAIREAQATGQVHNRREAFALAEKILSETKEG